MATNAPFHFGDWEIELKRFLLDSIVLYKTSITKNDLHYFFKICLGESFRDLLHWLIR